MTYPDSSPRTFSEEELLKYHFLRDHFFNREDYVTTMAPWGKPTRAIPIRLNHALLSHVSGRSPKRDALQLYSKSRPRSLSGPYRLGSYSLNASGLTRWVCIDIDGPGHKDSVAYPTSIARQVVDILSNWSKPLVEKSGGGRGWHIWLFFAEFVGAQNIRDFILSVLPHGVLLDSGEIVPISSNRGVEIFPKSGTIREGGVGTMLWLPFWSGAAYPANHFVQLDSVNGYRVLDIRDIQICEIEELPVGYHEIAQNYVEVCQERETTGLTKWQIWRMDSLRAMDREIPYGDILTGKDRGDYWECRDPFAESGDKNPSAGISKGLDGKEPLRFHSLRNDRDMSVFGYLEETRKDIRSFPDALRFVSYHSGVPLP